MTPRHLSTVVGQVNRKAPRHFGPASLRREAHREKIFERFYRIDEGRGRDSGGVGLGLALTRWAVTVNGGRIELESEKPRGSLFRIVLPLDGRGAETPSA